MASVMDLNDVHKAQIQRFAQFFKGKRDKLCEECDATFGDYVSDRLSDDGAIFNRDDTEGLLAAYHQQVMAHIREGLETSTNLSAVYVTQLMSQAEQMGQYLQVEDISLVEDQSRLGQISSLAALQGAPPPVPKPRAPLPQLGATSNAGTDPVVLQELQDLRLANQQMTDRYQNMQTELSSLLKERSGLSNELEKMRANFAGMMASNPGLAGGADVAELEHSLNGTKAALDVKAQECEALRQDMNSRLGESTQFRDLKGIVKKKTDEIKNLKAVMVQYGIQPPEPEGGCIELAADSD